MDISAGFEQFRSAVGWVPAVVFPVATVIQLLSLARRKRSEGVSAVTWTLFALANLCLYLTIGEWLKPQVVLSTLGTALLQAVVVVLVFRFRAPAGQVDLKTPSPSGK